MGVPVECAGYKVVKLRCTPNSEIVHYLFMKEHSVREMCEEKPPDRTLFILGTPPFVTQENYKSMFSKFGTVEKIFFQSSPTASPPPTNVSKFFQDYAEVKGYKVAYVVFKEESSLSNVMSLDPDVVLELSTEDAQLLTGMTKWCKEYNSKLLVNVQDLQQDIDKFMAKFDKEMEEQNIKEKEEMEPDEEGWTKVTKKGRRPGFARKESVHNKIMKKLDEKKKKKQLLNFYRFQIKENKMNQLVKLREKFEEDKKKIALLKQSRKFRPF